MSATNEKLTQKTVAKPLPKGVTDRIVFDTAIPGFGLRTRAGGTQTWLFQFKLVWNKLPDEDRPGAGDEGRGSPQIALRHYNDVQQGKNPSAAKEAAKQLAAHTFGDLVRRYLEFKKTGKKPLRPRSYVEVARHLEVYAAPLHKLPVASIDRRMIEDCINKVVEKSTKGAGAVTANRLHSSLSALFTWGMKKGSARHGTPSSASTSTKRSRDPHDTSPTLNLRQYGRPFRRPLCDDRSAARADRPTAQRDCRSQVE